MLRKFITALILIPLAVVVIALAVANRQPVLVSFDPFDQLHPAMVVHRRNLRPTVSNLCRLLTKTQTPPENLPVAARA